ncbi:MMPL family transporter [Luteococcus sp. OSA5]|uniref:MMPL family transporter n=1 Tax=Luteococcus sp. OSA5 TaxID=3401630 RepID=UPI003B431D0D
MSRLLYRWGRWAATHTLPVLAGWLILVVGVGTLLVTQPKVVSTSLTLKGTPAQQVLDDLTRELPGADGTQGTLAITAEDGGRVDTPERARALAEAHDAARATGYLVDRDKAMAAQQKELSAQVRGVVEERFAAELRPTITAVAGELTTSQQKLAARSAQLPPEQRAQLGKIQPRVGALAGRAQHLADAPAATLIADSGKLLTDIERLQADLRRLGMDGVAALPMGTTKVKDPKGEFERAVASATKQAQADLTRLTAGSTPGASALRAADGRTLPGVLLAHDGTAAVLSLQFSRQLSELPAGALEEVLAAVERPLAAAGMTAAPSASLQPLSPPLGVHEAVGLGVALVVLVLTLGSLSLAGLPLVTALIGVLIGVGGAFAMSAHFEMTTATPAIGLMLGLAVGIDYALFLVHKQRSLVRHAGVDEVEGVGRAVATAGGAILFAGATVVVALLGLLSLGIGFVSSMALVAALTVFIAVALALTAVPALLGLLVGSRRVPRSAAVDARQSLPGHRFGRLARGWIRLLTVRPLVTILVITLGLGALALPVRDLHLGMPSGAVAVPGSDSRRNYDVITQTLGEGANAPLVVTLRPQDAARVDQKRLLSWQADLAGRPSVADARLMGATRGHTLLVFAVTPTDGPDASSTSALVHQLRRDSPEGIASTGVTGLTALNLDLSDVLRAAIPTYLAIVLGLSLLILVLVFRSLVVPAAATLGFLLSIGAALGLTVLVFGTGSLGWLVGADRAGPILSFLPIMATGILYGLAMDYQVFLGTAIREEHVRGAAARQAVLDGFHHASRVVLAAAVIMVSVFAGFVLTDDTTIRQFGFALAVGILLDAFLVRMALMPAVLYLAGERAWWLPGWLQRLLPQVDIEGAGLMEQLDAPPTARGNSNRPGDL